MENNAIYNPRILKSLIEICAEMGVGKETVREWIDQGAPIIVEQDGCRTRYSAALAALHSWRLAQARKGRSR